ncbi:unnamed protein product [Cylindrotheca closterium]|uniref:Lipoyl-binding domain-containing protein n=1 Tax=Cylindrotheca closterium TaxID=2856 RepID=A0AAD2G957_9STRA|nr:unnamed protein product [Cylindrotheca closterium]
MTKPQHLCLLALVSAARGLTSFPCSLLHKQSLEHTCSTALRYQDDAFVDVEVLSHQKIDLLRSQSRTTSESKDDGTSSAEAIISYREIRIPLDWYPERQIVVGREEDGAEGSTACSAYRLKEGTRIESHTTMVKVVEWKKQPGDVVTQGDIMVILQKSQIDSYGRTVNKQRIEVASKEDGILKTIVIPQGEELNLRKQKSRSLIALFHPTLFLSIDIDKSTRMDTVLLRQIQQREESENAEVERRESKELIIEKESSPIALEIEGENDENYTGSFHRAFETNQTFSEEKASPTSSNGTKTKQEDNGSHRVISEKPLSTSLDSTNLESAQQDNHKGYKISDVNNITLMGDTEAIRAIESGNATNMKPNSKVEDDVVLDHERIVDLAVVAVANQLFSNFDSTASKPTDPTTNAKLPQNATTSRQEAQPNKIMQDVVHANDDKDILKPFRNIEDDAVLDHDRIVDLAAKAVVNELFGDLYSTMSKTTKAKPNEPISNIKLPKSATTSKQDVQHNVAMQEVVHASQQASPIKSEEDSRQSKEKPWGSKKSEVFTVIVDFFTENFQKTHS